MAQAKLALKTPYTGEKLQEKFTDKKDQEVLPYQPDDGLIEAVNLAIALDRPLLLRGEPGCGKTCLAKAVAHDLYGQDKYEKYFFEYHVRSTSRGHDLCYTYDQVARLRDAQLAKFDRLSTDELEKINDLYTYVRPGIFDQAFKTDERAIVLIDEIDKANYDFPNDLLLVLDETKFAIEELKHNDPRREVKAKHKPIVFITSNDDRELPEAFLRRCLCYFIEFPSEKHLKKILNCHFPSADSELIEKAIERFQDLREEVTGKKPSSSELIDWFRMLSKPDVINYKTQIISELEQGRLPFASILIKSWPDHEYYLSELAEADQKE